MEKASNSSISSVPQVYRDRPRGALGGASRAMGINPRTD